MAFTATRKMLLRVFHPSRHLWLETISQNASHRWLKLGLTERGLEDIGDVTCIQINQDSIVKRGQELLQIHFEGHSITAADELYHTSWETFSDKMNILSPLSGTLGDNDNSFHHDQIIDEETVLATIKVEEEEFQRQCKEGNLVHEPQYLKLVRSISPGKFQTECTKE